MGHEELQAVSLLPCTAPFKSITSNVASTVPKLIVSMTEREIPMQNNTIAKPMMRSVACHESVHSQEKNAVGTGTLHNKLLYILYTSVALMHWTDAVDMAIYYSSAQQERHTNGLLATELDVQTAWGAVAQWQHAGKMIGVSCPLNHRKCSQTDQVEIDRWRNK